MYQPPAPATTQPPAPITSVSANAARLSHRPLRGSGRSGLLTAEEATGAGALAEAEAGVDAGADDAKAASAEGMPDGVVLRSLDGRSGTTLVGSKSGCSAPMHSIQNLATARFSVPQAGQISAISAPPGLPNDPAAR